MYDCNVNTTREVSRLINILIADKTARAKRADNLKYKRVLLKEIDVLNDVLSLYPKYFKTVRYIEKKISTINLMLSDADAVRILDTYVYDDMPNWLRSQSYIYQSFMKSFAEIKNNGYNE